MKRVLLSALMTLSLVGCAGSLNTFPVKGKDTELAKVKGNWEGEYTSPDTGRSGTISFTLDLGHATGEGEVLMDVPGEPAPRSLRIASMHVDGSEVKGRLRRYTDPACNCQVDTEFSGVVVGETIDGTFVIKPVGKDVVAGGGTWHAERVGM
jgi:hypothetical protein